MTLEEAAQVLLKASALGHARAFGSAAKTCREFEVPRSSFCRWREADAAEGRAGLIGKKPVGKRWPNQLFQDSVEKIVHLRRQNHMGPQRIAWYLERYHGIRPSCSMVCRTLVRPGMGRLPRKASHRTTRATRLSAAPALPSEQDLSQGSRPGRIRNNATLPNSL
jgi:hypothetical protein